MFLLAFVFAAAWFVTGSMAAHLPRLLERWGATPLQAIAAAALVGPAQVAARLLEFLVLRAIDLLVSARIAKVIQTIEPEKGIRKYEMEAKKNDPAGSYAKESLPVLHKHLETAQSLSAPTTGKR